MPSQIAFNPLRAISITGRTSPGALATFFQSGTTTPITVYTTLALDVAHPTPLVSDAQGVFPQVWTDGAVSIKVSVTDAKGATLAGFPVDPVQLISSTGSAASSVSFAPITGNPATDVQEAIENLTDFESTATDFGGTSPFATAAQGVTADAALPSANYVKATKALAEAGADNTGYMTALRTQEHLLANALGWGQTYQDMTASRSFAVVYQNTTGRPIEVSVGFTDSGTGTLKVGTTSPPTVIAGRATPASGHIPTPFQR